MIHINNFIDKLKFFETKNSKDFIIPMSEAKNLHTDITKLLLKLHDITSKTQEPVSPKQIEVKGNNW